MCRRRSPEELTPREEEVLNLLRVGLTNEEIAQRLGISLNGARYHVSQILSKLGVATREEAAVLAVAERQRWWAAWPLWAGAATAAVAVAGVAVLVYDPISGESEEDLPAESALTLVGNDSGGATVVWAGQPQKDTNGDGYLSGTELTLDDWIRCRDWTNEHRPNNFTDLITDLPSLGDDGEWYFSNDSEWHYWCTSFGDGPEPSPVFPGIPPEGPTAEYWQDCLEAINANHEREGRPTIPASALPIFENGKWHAQGGYIFSCSELKGEGKLTPGECRPELNRDLQRNGLPTDAPFRTDECEIANVCIGIDNGPDVPPPPEECDRLFGR